MKKFILSAIIIVLGFTLNLNSYGQASAVAGFSFGYGQTAYNMKGYDPAPYYPIGFRLAIGMYGIQLGPDFWTTVSGPSFKFADTTGKELYHMKINDTYFGGMFRAHAGNDPEDFAVIFRAGMGMMFSKKTVNYSDYYLGMFPNLASGTFKYDNSVCYNAALGFSIPLTRRGQAFKVGGGNLHLTLEGVFNYNPRKYDGQWNYHTSWGVQIGLCYYYFNYETVAHR
jgi:hypothetical protein